MFFTLNGNWKTLVNLLRKMLVHKITLKGQGLGSDHVPTAKGRVYNSSKIRSQESSWWNLNHVNVSGKHAKNCFWVKVIKLWCKSEICFHWMCNGHRCWIKMRHWNRFTCTKACRGELSHLKVASSVFLSAEMLTYLQVSEPGNAAEASWCTLITTTIPHQYCSLFKELYVENPPRYLMSTLQRFRLWLTAN